MPKGVPVHRYRRTDNRDHELTLRLNDAERAMLGRLTLRGYFGNHSETLRHLIREADEETSGGTTVPGAVVPSPLEERDGSPPAPREPCCRTDRAAGEGCSCTCPICMPDLARAAP